MHYRPSQARYAGGGQVKYLVYQSPQPLRTGRVQDRTHVRRLYFPANATEISVKGPQKLTTRTGRQVYGVAVHYRYHLRGATAHRNKTTMPCLHAGLSARKWWHYPKALKRSRSPTSRRRDH